MHVPITYLLSDSVAVFLMFIGLFVSATVRRLYDIANILIVVCFSDSSKVV